MKTIEEVREFFRNDRYATESGAVIDEVGEHSATVSLELGPMHKNAVGGVMGGVYFTLADFAFAVSTNWQEPGTVSLTSDISFIGTPKSGRLIAESTLIKDGRSVCTYSITVTDDLGNLCAAVKTVGMKLGSKG